MNNLITIAVLENRPELITSHPDFNINSLETDARCMMNKMREIKCDGLDCEENNCPFSSLNGRTILSAKQWLKLEPLEQPTTYTEQEVLALCKRSYNLRTIDKDVRSTKSFEEWFNNNKKK